MQGGGQQDGPPPLGGGGGGPAKQTETPTMIKQNINIIRVFILKINACKYIQIKLNEPQILCKNHAK
jgi:hypothetical protein